MLQKLSCVLVAIAVLAAHALEPPPPTWNAVPPLHVAFEAAFAKEGFSEKDIHDLETRYYQEGIDTLKWPFSDRGKELFDSMTNPANHNAAQVKDAAKAAGCDLGDSRTFTAERAEKALKLLAQKSEDTASSMLETSSENDPVLYNIATNAQRAASAAQYLKTGISMSTGSVASNAASISALSSAVATNAGELVGLSSAVSSMSQVTGPTVALAGALGVPVSTVSSMALAGSFLGPMLGVIAIVYAAWPEEEVDPWLKVEARVAQMVNEKFDAKRRKRLGDRLRRYVKQFARCSQAWVSEGLVKLHGVSLPRWLVEDALLAKGSGGDLQLYFSKSSHNYAAPPCTAQLEAHMSLERDEWFKTDAGQMSGLFMPFANMHTQLLSMLNDHPFDDSIEWAESLKNTASEYGTYMLDHLVKAWKAQVCRTMRLRHSLKGGIKQWRYHFVVLKAVVQPNAAEDCSDKCGGESGWCNFCGGVNDGACCQKGEGGVCEMFDAPVTWHGRKYHACVHTDCVQGNTGYYGKVLQTFGARENGSPRVVEECQELCRDVTGAVAFTLNQEGRQCTCLAQDGLTRHQEKDAKSGPTVCQKHHEETLQELEEAFQESTNETTKVPMEEIEACEKSPSVSNFAELEEKHMDWVQGCFKKATKVATIEYNTFYQRFARFVDMLTWKAGCGSRHEVEWEETAKRNGFEIVSKAFDGGSFADCNWQREESKDKNMWVFDETRARGWTRSSRVNMEEQSQMKTMYPMPSWLRDLRNVHPCLRKTTSGQVTDPNNAVSSAIDTLMEPAAMDESSVTAPAPPPNTEYEELLRQLRSGA